MTDTEDTAESQRDTSNDYRVRNDTLRTLVEEWKELAENVENDDYASAKIGCAFELEAVIEDAE